jgi:hypothetical protein
MQYCFYLVLLLFFLVLLLFLFGLIPVPVIFFGLITVPVIFFGLIPVPVIFFGLVTTPLKTPHLALLRPPYLFLVLLQSSVFGLITTPLFLVLLRDPLYEPRALYVCTLFFMGHPKQQIEC